MRDLLRLLSGRDAVAGALLIMAIPAHVASAPQRPAAAGARPDVVRGIYNWIHSTADPERAFPFYRDVLGIEVARSPFGGPAPANAAPERIRPVSGAAPDPLVWDLTDTKGSRFRNVFTRAPNTPFGLELSEFLDIPRETRAPNAWDPGASMLIFRVRSLDPAMDRVKASGAPVVTIGGQPVDTSAGRAVIVRDPDGYLVQLVQASAREIAAAAPGDVISTAIGISVADTAAAMKFYQGLLGFDVRETRRASAAERQLHGLTAGELTQTSTHIPGTSVAVVFLEFKLPAGTTPAARPFRWRIQDVGAPQFQLQVRDLDALIEQTRQAGYRFLSIGARPIQRAFGRFVFAIDPDGVLVEYVEPAPPR